MIAAVTRFLRQRPRSTAFFALVAAVVVVWSSYARLTADGVIAGRVVDESGRAVADAEVILREKTLNYAYPPQTVRTDEEGEFTFEEMSLIEFVIEARKEGYERSGQKRYHLYFKRQHFELPEPLVLAESGSADGDEQSMEMSE